MSAVSPAIGPQKTGQVRPGKEFILLVSQITSELNSGCYELTVEYLRWTNIEAVIAACFAALGICAMAFTSVVFIIFNNTPVVKSTTRELSYIILVGIFLCYAATFVIIQRPTQVTCYLLRIGPGVAFAMMYGALLTKTNRIARILAGSKKRILTKKPRFLTTTAQLVITALLVGLELSIITAMLIYEPPDIRYDYSRARRVLLLCNTTSLGILAPLGFDFFLICLCTLYAVKTRSLPQNFNEAKFIGFTMYTTCIIWLAFLTIYFGSDSQSITMCFSFSLSATVALILLFFPKLYIILFKVRSYTLLGDFISNSTLLLSHNKMSGVHMRPLKRFEFTTGQHPQQPMKVSGTRIGQCRFPSFFALLTCCYRLLTSLSLPHYQLIPVSLSPSYRY